MEDSGQAEDKGGCRTIRKLRERRSQVLECMGRNVMGHLFVLPLQKHTNPYEAAVRNSPTSARAGQGAVRVAEGRNVPGHRRIKR